MILLKPLSQTITVLTSIFSVILTIKGENQLICQSNEHFESGPSHRKLEYSVNATSTPTIEYSVLELLELFDNSTHGRFGQIGYSGILVTHVSKHSSLGSWQWSAGNRAEGSPPDHWHWHDFNASDGINPCMPTRSHISAFNVSKYCKDAGHRREFSGIIVPKTHYIRFTPFRPFWSLLDGIGETAMIFTGMTLKNEIEYLKPQPSLATELLASDSGNSDYMFVLRADWTDCTNELILTDPRSIDACGICGGDGSECLDCKGVMHGNAKYKCGMCIENEAEMTRSRCENYLESLPDDKFNDTEITSSGKAEIIGPSSMRNLCDGHSVEIILNNEDYNGSNLTGRSDYHYHNWTLHFETRKPPRNQAEVLKIWDTVRHLQKNLNNQTQDQLLPGIIPRYLINSSMLADGVVYTATLYMSNSRGKTDFGSHYKFHISKHPDPTGFTVEIMGETELDSDTDGYFEARILACEKNDSKSYRIYKVLWNINGTFPLRSVPGIQHGAVLPIPRDYWQPGKVYNVSVFVIDDSNLTAPTRYASASTIVRVNWRSAGEIDHKISVQVQFSQSQIVELMPGLPNSFEGSKIPEFEVYWRCRTINDKLCFRLGSEETLEELLGDAVTRPILEFPANVMAPGNYVWTAFIFDGPRCRTYSSRVSILSGSTSTKTSYSKIILVEDNHGRLNDRNVDPSGFIKVLARIFGDSSTNGLNVNWYVQANELSQNRTFAPEFEESSNSSISGILISNLLPGTEYSITLKCLENGDPIAYEEINIRTGKPPRGGIFKVDPTHGVALRTPFEFQIHSWLSGNNANEVLRYEIGYTTPEWLDGISESDIENVVQWLQGHTSELTHTIDYLPTGDQSGEIIPVLKICDRLTCTLRQHEPLKMVAPEEGYTMEDIRAFDRVLQEKLRLWRVSEGLCYMESVLRSFGCADAENQYWSNLIEIIQGAVRGLNTDFKYNFKLSNTDTEIDRIFNLIEKMLMLVETKNSANELHAELLNLRNTVKKSYETQCSEIESSVNTRGKRETEKGNLSSEAKITRKIITVKHQPQPIQSMEFVLTSDDLRLHSNSKKSAFSNSNTVSLAENSDSIINVMNYSEDANNASMNLTKDSNNTNNNINITTDSSNTSKNLTKESNNTTNTNLTKDSNSTNTNTNLTNNSNITNTNLTKDSNSANTDHPEDPSSSNTNITKNSNTTNMILTTKEITEILLKAEKQLLDKEITQNITVSGIHEIHEAAKLLCQRIHSLGEPEATITGNLTRIKVGPIIPEMTGMNISNNIFLEGHQNSSRIDIMPREAMTHFCPENRVSYKRNCHGVCRGLMYFAKDILAPAQIFPNNNASIWEVMVIRAANKSESEDKPLKNDTEQRFPVIIELRANASLINKFNVECAGWNPQSQVWDTGQCETNALIKHRSTLTCVCKKLGFYKLIYTALSEDFGNSYDYNNASQELEEKLGVWFRLSGYYNETIGKNKTEFENHVWKQLLNQLGDTQEFLYTVTNVTVRRESPANLTTGNIIVGLILERNKNVSENSTEDSVNILKLLDTTLLNGTLSLTDLNNNKIPVPRQNLKRNAAFRQDLESGLAGWVILGAIVCIGLLAIIVVIRKHKREREDSVRPMRTEQYNLRGEPIARSSIKPVRHVDSADGPLTSSNSVTTMATSFNSLSTPESGTVSSTIQWHANQIADDADNLNDIITSPGSSHRGSTASSRIVYLMSDQTGVSTNPMVPVDNSISSFPNSTMFN